MSRISTKPGRRISLNVIVDYDRAQVQIIRQLHDTKGFLVDSGNMGWMPIDEFRAFLADAKARTDKRPTLMSRFDFNLPEESQTAADEALHKLRQIAARDALTRGDIATAMDLAPDASILAPRENSQP
jgi:hypothetical protein